MNSNQQHIDKEAMTSILGDIVKLGNFSSNSISKITLRYPFFQTAHLLLTKKFQLEDNTEYKKQLKKAAAYAGDRENLFHLIHPEHKVEDIEEKPSEPILKDKKKKTAASDHPKKESQADSADDTSTTKKTKRKKLSSKSDEKLAVSKPKDKITKQIPSGIDTFEPRSFTDWLAYYKIADIQEDRFDKAEEPLNISKDEDNLKLIQDFLDANKPKEKLSKDKKTPKSPEQSLKEDPNLITETLAEIHYMQGNIEKAISIYEQLILKYPKKSSYFAKKIEDLTK